MKKLAIIGCGGIGGYHLGHFLGFRDIIDLVGFCDLIPERAEKFVERAGCGKAFTDFRKMYDEVKPDIVFICIPPYKHGDIEYETIARKIPFFVEKPVSLDLGLARDIRDKVAAAGLVTGVGFQCRYSDLVEPNKKFIAENEIVFIECARIGGVPGTEWWATKSLSGGQIVEQTVHQFDIIRYVYGEPEEVFTFGTRGFVKQDNYDTDDLTTTAVRFKSGALGMISTGCYATSGNAFDSKVTFSSKDKRADLKILSKFEVFGEKPAEPKQEDGLVVKGDGTLGEVTANSIVYRPKIDAGILCDRTFIEAAISGDGSKVRSPYADGVRTLEFVLACNKSMETGLPVKIEMK